MEEGKIVTTVPKPSRRSKYGINWDEQARLARLVKQPVLVGSNIRNTQVKSLRQYDRDPFVTDEGRISIMLRNSSISPKDGKRYGDVYFEWVPTTTTDTKEN